MPHDGQLLAGLRPANVPWQWPYKCSCQKGEKTYIMLLMKTRGWGSATAAVVRELVNAERPLMQRELAERCATSQPRVSQVLVRLAEDGLVRRMDDGWTADRQPLVMTYLDRYRPRETDREAWWYALDTLSEQAHRIVDAHGSLAVSADLAADLTTPWRRPSTAIVWAPEPLDLSVIGFVSAESKAVATVIVRVTDDARLFDDRVVVDGLPLTERFQQATDLMDLGGSDRAEAAAILMGISPEVLR
ncbi:MAG: MarR family transcriptional regulator [Acidimicrobiia bacterium]|nr:MarR family transcriptional regulator [Acidimicrobiia bacterium]